MNKFKPRDKVKCVVPHRTLIKDKVYTILSMKKDGDYFYCNTVEDPEEFFYTSRFVKMNNKSLPSWL